MTEGKDIQVIGIDPAPSKGNVIFNGVNFIFKTNSELKDYLNELSDNTLICWDAPLSFSTAQNESPFTQRIIEKFFMRSEWAKTPTGISVLGYSGCSHWTISQYILGYPQISPFAEKLTHEFKLIFDKDEVKKNKKSVTEVHPAVAIWIWCKDNGIKNWKYKNNEVALKVILENLKSKEILDDNIINLIMKEPRGHQDDYLDAYIAWKLGSEWINCTEIVEILGNNDTGSFLLPYNKDIFDKFNQSNIK